MAFHQYTKGTAHALSGAGSQTFTFGYLSRITICLNNLNKTQGEALCNYLDHYAEQGSSCTPGYVVYLPNDFPVNYLICTWVGRITHSHGNW